MLFQFLSDASESVSSALQGSALLERELKYSGETENADDKITLAFSAIQNLANTINKMFASQECQVLKRRILQQIVAPIKII